MATKRPKLRDRVIDFRRVKARDLEPHPRNWRLHPKAQSAALKGILEEVGVAGALLAYERDGKLTVIDGHLRKDTAPDHEWPVVVLDVTDEEADYLLATHDPLAAMAQPDQDKLLDLLASVDTQSQAVKDMLEALANGETQPLPNMPIEDVEPRIDEADELRKKWGVERGQVWTLGEHRLMCGDSTNTDDVRRLVDGRHVDLVLTDPPYAVDYAAKNRALQTIGRSDRLTTDIAGDGLGTEQAAKTIWGPSFANAYEASRNGTVIYSFAPQGGDQMMMMMMMMRAHWNERLHQLIWRKNAPTFSMGRLDYSYQHEPILYSWRGTNHGFYGEGARSVIDCDRPSASKLHPTMKPVELFEILVRNSSRSGEIVYEPFSGSGTTLIACERLGRRCRAVEIAPGYVAVSLQRWADATGKTPVLADG